MTTNFMWFGWSGPRDFDLAFIKKLHSDVVEVEIAQFLSDVEQLLKVVERTPDKLVYVAYGDPAQVAYAALRGARFRILEHQRIAPYAPMRVYHVESRAMSTLSV